MYGPVSGIRWVGTWHDEKVWIERWEVRTSHSDVTTVVEMSLVQADYFDALELRDRLAAHLRQRGWLHEQDDLKTRIVLDAFAARCGAPS